MKLNCGPTWEEIYADILAGRDPRQKWHSWFAWRPVRVGPRDCRWLETVLRKGQYCEGFGGSSWTWFYRGV